MAKMFYTLEETAARLGLNEDQVKHMASEGKLQQFRDRDKLMFKRDQVDALAGSSGSTAGGSVGLAETSAGDSVDILGDTDAVNPSDATDAGQATGAGTGTGISVFDTSEIEHADPRAQTQLSQPSRAAAGDEELALDSVGSGSGLLDLTRESDDTSLGVALDEIYPGGTAAAGSGSGTAMESAVGSSGVFESALGMESAAGVTGSSSGLDNLAAGDSAIGVTAGAPVMTAYEAEAYDPAGSGFGAGVLLGALVALILGLIVSVAQLTGAHSGVTSMLADSGPTMMWVYLGGLFVLSLVLGFIGMAVGRSAAR